MITFREQTISKHGDTYQPSTVGVCCCLPSEDGGGRTAERGTAREAAGDPVLPRLADEGH